MQTAGRHTIGAETREREHITTCLVARDAFPARTRIDQTEDFPHDDGEPFNCPTWQAGNYAAVTRAIKPVMNSCRTLRMK